MLYLTGSPAVAVILWVVGGLIIFCIVLSWLELGLTIPRHYVRSVGAYFSAPRSGGDKNYLEYIYQRPRLFASCVFGITFILFGNLAGNAIQFGVYMQGAISPQCTEDDACFNKVAVILWALGIICLCSFLNILARRLFISLNNLFAIAKFLFVAVTALLGIIYGASHGDGCRTNMAWSNRGPGGELGDIALAMFYAMFSYTGFEQPFYVLAEVERPRDNFPKYVILALASVMVLFPLTNVGYLCVVPYGGPQTVPKNMALEFFDIIARNGDPHADTTAVRRVISVILAVIIIGNIMAQTFTGSRVKQEIGKEAIIPFSLAIATGSDSIAARFLAPADMRRQRSRQHFNSLYIENHSEQVPMAGTLLHTASAVVLILAVGIPTKPSNAFRILTYLRVFSIIVVLGLLTVAGLAYLKIDSWIHGSRSPGKSPGGNPGANVGEPRRGRRWLEKRVWAPWFDPLPTFVATAALAFMAVAIFVKPSQIREDERAVPAWVNPLTGWLALLLGVLWWAGLRVWQWKTKTRTEVVRRPHLVIDKFGNAVLKAEFIQHRRWERRYPGQEG